MEHANYPGGGFTEKQLTGTFHQCRWGEITQSPVFLSLYFRKLCEGNPDCCHWSWSTGDESWCWLKTKKVTVVPGRESHHISGSKICTNQCEPGVCMEHARYPGGSGGDASMQHVAETFHECRCGK